MDFADFAKLYGFLRIRLNRADDLLVEHITYSEAEEIVEANSGGRYFIRTAKDNYAVTVRVVPENGRPVLDAGADLRDHEVVVGAQTVDTIAILDMFESENLNGLETMAYYEAQTPSTTDPMAEYNEAQRYAEKAARLIVAGIGEVPALNPEEQALVAVEIVAILKDPSPFGFGARVQRVIAWTMRLETQSEWGVYVARWVMQTHPEHVEDQREVFARFSPLGQHIEEA